MQNSFIKTLSYNMPNQAVDIEFIKSGGLEIPRTIYKYRAWDNKYHQRLLTKREVYFPTVHELNDPFDCQRNFDWEELKDSEIHNRYVHIAAERVARIHNWSEEEKKEFIVEGLKQKMDDEMVSEMESEIEENDRIMGTLQGTFTASLINNSILLWSHYGDSHRGFCVGFNTKVLLKEIKFSTGMEAKYFPKLVVTSMLDDIETAISDKIFSKYDAWAYEHEYRIVAGQLKNKKVFASPEAFKEIIFGINMTHENKEYIKYRVKKQMPHVEFRQAKKVKNEYRIEIVNS